MQLTVRQSDDNRFTYSNIVSVSSDQFSPSQFDSTFYVKLNNQYVCTAGTSRTAYGEIGLSRPQRNWTGTSTGDIIEVEKYDPFQEGGIGSLTVDVSFGVAKTTTETQYDEDQLQQHFTKVCQ